jgi:dCTP diphosphatase
MPVVSREIAELQEALRKFAEERDWEQFHSPKNLAAALTVEAAELLEHFQWLSEEQSRSLDEAKSDKVSEELADVLLYLLQLSDKLGIDLLEAARRKLQANAAKYPVEHAKGSSKKYSEF